MLQDPDHRYLLYFLPLQSSYTNATITATTSKPDLVYAQEGGLKKQLIVNKESLLLERYVNSAPDTRRSMDQLGDFFTFFYVVHPYYHDSSRRFGSGSSF